MGQYEIELRTVLEQGYWTVPHQARLQAAVGELSETLTSMSAFETRGKADWSGQTADAAREAFRARGQTCHDYQESVARIGRIVKAANAALDAATASVNGLPSANVPQSDRDLINAARERGDKEVVVQGVTQFIDDAFDFVAGLFGNSREDQARRAREKLDADLAGFVIMLRQSLNDIQDLRVDDTEDWGIEDPGGTIEPNPPIVVAPPPPGPDSERPSPAPRLYKQQIEPDPWKPGPGVPGVEPDPWKPGPGVPHVEPDPWDGGPGDQGGGPGVSADFGGGGYTPGYGGSNFGGMGLGIGGGAAAAALRMGSGAGAGGAGRARGLAGSATGSGGLLGSGAGAAGGAGAGGAGAGGAGAGAGAAGGRGAMIGGGGAGAGKNEKNKRSGLGGHIAPKLEDDEEFRPLPEGAQAGGRRGNKEDTP